MNVLHYLKYFLFHAIGLLAAGFIMAGQGYVTLGLLTVLVIYMVGDAVAGDDTSTPTFKHPGILTFQLWMALPLGPEGGARCGASAAPTCWAGAPSSPSSQAMT